MTILAVIGGIIGGIIGGLKGSSMAVKLPKYKRAIEEAFAEAKEENSES